MADTPNVLGRRYLPFLAVIGVQVLLAAVAPSRGILTGQFAANGANGNGSAVDGGSGSSGGAGGGSSGAGGTFTNGTTGATGGGATGHGGGAGGGGGVGGGDLASLSGGPTFGGGTGAVDRSDCTADGFQIGPPRYVYMPPCVPVWHGGDNGGSTMPGVTATQIKFVLFKPMANAQVNAILATQDLAASTTQSCQADIAYLKVINKYWTTYGRKFVSMDGPGTNAGSSSQGCSGFPYFQSQCPLTPPDPACDVAEAKVVASMHPAYLTGAPSIFFVQALASYHIPMLTGGEAPESYYEADAPYVFGLLMDGQRQSVFDGEYWCKKLNNKQAAFAGADVKTGRNWGPAPGVTPTRKLAIIFPENNGDESARISVNQIKAKVTGGECNTPGGVLEISYASNINTAQQQSDTIVQELINNHITTVACFCDPIAPVFLTNTMAEQGYTPEHWILGVGLIDYDQLARLYNPAEWSHAFGVSDLTQYGDFAQSDAQMWWTAGGMSGAPDKTEGATVPVFATMASAFQLAGPQPTPARLAAGLQSGPTYGGWAKYHNQYLYEVGFKSPDPWTATRDVREVYWSNTRASTIDNKQGSYCPVNGGKRYDPGEFDSILTPIFNSSGC